ncbi:hypothetical protein AAE478_007979 [Parahypoxylon ruwenzoriense]
MTFRHVYMLALYASVSSAGIIRRDGGENQTGVSTAPSQFLRRADDDPADFGWIKRWAAIGDSFTAGIGSGHPMGNWVADLVNYKGLPKGTDWRCSRYDQSYPMVIHRALGPKQENFQFPACSGDRSVGIYQQVQDMEGDLDFVVLTAGGNDLCLADMIKKCIMYPFQGDQGCQIIIDKAQENIDTILKPNLKQILIALNDRMRKDSVVVYNSYAQYFNTDNEDCAKKQDWTIFSLHVRWWQGLPLTMERRKQFNQLVVNINAAIQETVDDVSQTEGIKYKIGFSDWDPWPQEGPDLQFLKPDTYKALILHDELRKRHSDRVFLEEAKRAATEDVYDTLLFKSPNPAAAALHRLDAQAPSPPGCPGDGGTDYTGGLGSPDKYGKNFHPNELGHLTIASFAMDTLVDLRAQVLGKDSSKACADEFKCYQEEGRKAYASPDQLNKNYKDFCSNYVQPPEHQVGWKAEKTYHKGTPDEHTLRVQLSEEVADFNENECLDSMDRIINGCDGNDPKNPMNWKFGGRWVRGEYTYEVEPTADYRPQNPIIQRPSGSCHGDYYVTFSGYDIYGSGFSGHDWGQETLLPAIKGCLGLGVTMWTFEYQKSGNGDEWHASFNTPIFVRARCFENNNVVFAAGGFTDGCSGSDP